MSQRRLNFYPQRRNLVPHDKHLINLCSSTFRHAFDKSLRVYYERLYGEKLLKLIPSADALKEMIRKLTSEGIIADERVRNFE